MVRNKLAAVTLTVAMAAGILGACGSSASTNSAETSTQTNAQSAVSEQAADENESTTATESTSSDGKTLVVYYSAQGHTVNFAEAIANELGADLFEIVPENEYTEEDLNWNDSDSRVSKEHDDESLRDVPLVTTEVENWEEYDTVYIGYPIWWGIAAWPVNNFVTENDFTGKTVIPFCTSSSSGIGESGELLEEMAGNGNWMEGERFQSDQDTAEAAEWAAGLTA